MNPQTEQWLNLSHPLQARRWLGLIQENPVSGIRIRPSLHLDPDYFGFSFASNALGLRGPANPNADNVIMGTSFAMGLGVDVGLNWYEYDRRFDSWLNLGLPAGIREWIALLADCHRGASGRLVMLYHPNIWNMTWQYSRWQESGRPVFAHFGWKTGRLACWRLALQRRLAQRRQLAKGELIRFRHGEFDYEVPARFTFFKWQTKGSFVATVLDELRACVSQFQQVLVIRVPVKQQLVPDEHRNPILSATLTNYDELWQQTAAALDGTATCVEWDSFDLDDYLPHDVHWNERGNRKAAQLLSAQLGPDL